MAIHDPYWTLAHHKSRVLHQHRDMSGLSCPQVAKALKSYMKTHSPSDGHASVPEGNALAFYGLNHYVALISASVDPYERLPDQHLELLTVYHNSMSEAATRAFYYLLLICTREARHNKSLTSDYPKMVAHFGEVCAGWFKMSGGEGTIHEKFIDNPPDVPLGLYVDCLVWQFYKSSWAGGYGGKAWGVVTDCLANFVYGRYSAEMMLDTVWTLAHNNGPIFNKGHLYQMYTPNLVRILDIQRSGQIPEAVLTDKVNTYASPDLKKWMSRLAADFPKDIGAYVDWYKVEMLGSVHKYHGDKNAQVKAHGVPEHASHHEKALAAAEHAKALKAAAEKKAFFDANYEVSPGVFVPKIKLKRAA